MNIELIPFKKFINKAYKDFDENIIDDFFELGENVGYELASPKGDTTKSRIKNFKKFDAAIEKLDEYEVSSKYKDLKYEGPKLKTHRLIDYERMETLASEKGWLYASLKEVFLKGYNKGYEKYYSKLFFK